MWYFRKNAVLLVYGFECLQPPRSASQLTVTKISIYTIYLYVFITVKTAPQLNCLSRTAQTAVTIRNHMLIGNKGVISITSFKIRTAVVLSFVTFVVLEPNPIILASYVV